MKVFGDYSLYYDLLYKDKNYDAEVDYILNLVEKYKPNAKNFLELGCGTGKHAKLLNEKGLEIHGIDISQEMLNQAKIFSNEKLSFEIGDVRKYQIDRKFDVVLSLFHVASYQNTNDDLEQYFATAAKHLNKGGLFIFDFWYGPAVLNLRPENRVKYLENDLIKVERKASPKIDCNKNIVEVVYDIAITNKSSKEIKKIKENHNMRYFFLPELKFVLDKADFDFINAEEWLSKKEIGFNSWGACIVGAKK